MSLSGRAVDVGVSGSTCCVSSVGVGGVKVGIIAAGVEIDCAGMEGVGVGAQEESRKTKSVNRKMREESLDEGMGKSLTLS